MQNPNPYGVQGLMGQFQRFKGNPMQFLMENNVNIPQQYMYNPEGAIQYLLNNGSMSQGNLNYLIQQARSMGIRL